MKIDKTRIKRALKQVAIMILIVLASAGIGIAGAAVLPKARRFQDKEEYPVEMIETADFKNKLEDVDEKEEKD